MKKVLPRELPRTLPVLSVSLLGLALVLGACNDPNPGGGDNGGGGVLCNQSQGSLFATQGELGQIQLVNTPPANWNAPHVAGQVLVVTSPGFSAQNLRAQSLHVLTGIRTQTIDAGLTLAFTPAHESDADFAARLQQAGLKVQPNFVYQALATPNDPGYPDNTGVKVGATTYDQDYLTRIKADKAWAALAVCGKTNASALTAVLDTGVDSGHPDLAGRLLPVVYLKCFAR